MHSETFCSLLPSAFAEDGSVPDFSNRDAVFNDISAPGEGILSTLPRQLTAQSPGCPDQGYSSCGTEDYRAAEGTSFAAPQVTAAAAMLLSVDPRLTPDQVTTMLERTAADASGGNGCPRCPLGRDAFTGWGRLNVAAAIAALAGTLPPPDGFEPNDDAGSAAWPLSGSSGALHATLDFWDDQSDVYRILLRRGQKLFAVLSGPNGTDAALALWKPETEHVDDLRAQNLRIRQSARPGFVERLSYRAPRTAYYYLQVKVQEAAGGAGPYTLQFAKKS